MHQAPRCGLTKRKGHSVELALCNRCRPGAEQAGWETIRWRRPASLWGKNKQKKQFGPVLCILYMNLCESIAYFLFSGVCDLLRAGHQQHHHVRPGEEVLGQAVGGSGCKKCNKKKIVIHILVSLRKRKIHSPLCLCSNKPLLPVNICISPNTAWEAST